MSEVLSNFTCDHIPDGDSCGLVVTLVEWNAKLRELALALDDCRNTTCDDCVRWDYQEGECALDGVMRELGVVD